MAKKGRLRRHHFAHEKTVDCKGAVETALHLLSKELFTEIDCVDLPPYLFDRKHKTKIYGVIHHKQLIAKGGTASITKAYIERKEHGFIPDVLLICGAKSLIVEIAVTHKVDKRKLRLIRRSDLPAIEIQLSRDDVFLPREEIRHKLQHDLESKTWLFHPDQRNAENTYIFKRRQYIKAKRKNRAVALAAETKARQYSAITPIPLPIYNLAEFDRQVLEFYMAHKRQPTIEEYRRLWPWLWGKKSKL